jgi:hypothetical protein
MAVAAAGGELITVTMYKQPRTVHNMRAKSNRKDENTYTFQC